MLNQIAAIHGTGVAASTNSYESIQTYTVGAGGTSSISFTSIPNTFKHLQVRAINKSTSSLASGFMRFNSDTGANYSTHYLYGDGSSANVGAESSATRMYCTLVTGSTPTSTFGATVIDILDYANTNKYKTIRALAGGDVNGATGYIELLSGAWLNTSAVTNINIFPNAGSFAEHSHFALYGIKG